MGQHIFLSYSRKDIHIMQRIRDALRRDGLTIWTDESLITGSQSWKRDLENAIENASALVVVMTPNSKKSTWVREEMNYAEAQDVRIFPILAGGEPKDAVPFGFITAQWVDLRNEADFDLELQKLVFTLRGHAALSIADETTAPPHDVNEEEKVEAHRTTLAPDAPTRQRRTNKVFPRNISKAIMVLQDRNSKWWRRVDAINHIAGLGDPITLPVLHAFLEDADIDVQRAAAQAIERVEAQRQNHILDEEEQITDDVEAPTEPYEVEAIATIQMATPPAKVELDLSQMDEEEETAVYRAGSLRATAEAALVTEDDAVQRLKLVVTGPTDDLRARFIRAVSEINPVTINRDLKGAGAPEGELTTTASMSFGRITVADDLMIYLFGMPGQRQFDFMWKILSEGMLGFIFLVDSTQPHTFRDARAIFEKFRDQANVPFIIAADNTHQVDAWRPLDMRIAMRLGENVKIVPCDSSNPASVKKVLLELIYHISDDELVN